MSLYTKEYVCSKVELDNLKRSTKDWRKIKEGFGLDPQRSRTPASFTAVHVEHGMEGSKAGNRPPASTI
jgi:hypothetical protein